MLNPTFTAIVTAHGETPTKMIGNLMYQTHPPDEILCYVSGAVLSIIGLYLLRRTR